MRHQCTTLCRTMVPPPHKLFISHSEEAKIQISKSKFKGRKWPGYNPNSYWTIHRWAIKNIPKINMCSMCRKITAKLDMAYKDHSCGETKNSNYTRDLSMWFWLCRSCHMKADGRIHNLVPKSAKARHEKGLIAAAGRWANHSVPSQSEVNHEPRIPQEASRGRVLEIEG